MTAHIVRVAPTLRSALRGTLLNDRWPCHVFCSRSSRALFSGVLPSIPYARLNRLWHGLRGLFDQNTHAVDYVAFDNNVLAAEMLQQRAASGSHTRT